LTVRRCALVFVVGGLVWGAAPAPASALNPLDAVCGVGRVIAKGAAIPCAIATHAGTLLKVGKRLVGGHVGSAVGAATAAAADSSATVALAAMGVWVLGGARFALDETANVLGATTRPQLSSTWFSGTYWRMAGIAAVLTLPFLFAAAVQALVRSDLALLARATCMYLPLAVLAVSIAAPLTMLALAASDELSALVSGATGHESTHFLSAASLTIGALSALRSPFLAFLVGAFTVVGAVVLWVELLMREAAVYVIVLMLPLTFASFVWPARRIWAVRTVELLFALILSKFAIVAVLSLGGAALNTTLGTASVVNWLAGLVLVVLAAFMPWALLRFVPLAEVASGAAGSLRGELRGLWGGPVKVADVAARTGDEWVANVTAHMRRQAESMRSADGTVAPAGPGDEAPEPRSGEAQPAETTAGEPDLAPDGDEAADAAAGSPAGAQPTTRRASAAGDEAPARSPADWKPDILQADDQTRAVVLNTGEIEAARGITAPSPRGSDPGDPGDRGPGGLGDRGPGGLGDMGPGGVGDRDPGGLGDRDPGDLGDGNAADEPEPLPPPQDCPEGRV
jgi:hypothetical protein